MAWIDAFLYIFTKHWNKVDNFRIDKFLMLIRMQIEECLALVVKHEVKGEVFTWFVGLLDRILAEKDANQIGTHGITLHLADIFVTCLGEIAADTISLD